jgi:hypothetical protein
LLCRRRLSDERGGAGGSSASPWQQRRKEREQREAFREQYYAGGMSYGKPAACIMFDLAYYLAQDTANMLWLALVGLTDHLVHSRVSGGRGRRHGRQAWQQLCYNFATTAAVKSATAQGRRVQVQHAMSMSCMLATAAAADKYLAYCLHYEAYVSNAGHLDLQVGVAQGFNAVGAWSS